MSAVKPVVMNILRLIKRFLQNISDQRFNQPRFLNVHILE